MTNEQHSAISDIRQHIPGEWLTPEGQPVSGLSVAQQKRLELITKMTQDKDPVEYVQIFTWSSAWVLLCSLIHAFQFSSIMSVTVLVLAVAYFLFVRKRLAVDTTRLMQSSGDFDTYLWDGFHLKEMRQSAIKLGLILFFPASMVMAGDLIFSIENAAPRWMLYLIAYAIGAILVMVLFHDDSESMERLESDLNALKYL